MTLVILFVTFVFSEYNSISVSIMDKKTRRTMKGQSSRSITLSHEILDGSSRWARCNSFSSCSNDSSVSSSDRRLQNSSFSVGKCLTSENHASHLPKRNRNSSGSSVSSNMSCISDKDPKKTSVILSNSVPQVSADQSRIMGDVQGLARLSCPEMGSSGFGLQHEALLNDRLSCSDSSSAVLPFRHNLRRNIRKKTCSCDCTATCTTLVVRRYKEIGKKTVEEETVISSTKVQTCSKNNSSQKIQNVSYEKSFSPSKSDNRKRRSEVEKLYDSLHEIEWAKNFSPDNILRQLNIRQAASCSMFGRSTEKTDDRPSKKQRVSPNQMTKGDDPKTPESKRASSYPMHNTRSFTLRSHSKNGAFRKHNSCPSRMRTSKVSPAKDEPDSKELLCTPTKEENYELNVKEHINLANSKANSYLKCNSIQSFHASKDKSKFKANSDDQSSSSSGVSTPKIEFKTDSEIASDYSISPTFFDIAEEGIRTIDACFREVGAEVVISTCYEEDFELPHLTSVKENSSSEKFTVAVNDNPPILEPCVDISHRNTECNSVLDLPCQNKFVYKKRLAIKPTESEVFAEMNSESERVLDSADYAQVPKKTRIDSGNRCENKSLIKGAGKRILNKYLKLLRSRSQTDSIAKGKHILIPLQLVQENSQQNRNLENLPVIRTLRSNSSVNDRKSLAKSQETLSHLSMEPSFNFKTQISCESKEADGNVTRVETSNQTVSFSKSPEKVTFNHSKSKSIIYAGSKRSFTHISSDSVANKSVTFEANSNRPTTTENISNQSVVVRQNKISPFKTITRNSLVIKQSSGQKTVSEIRSSIINEDTNFFHMTQKDVATTVCAPIKPEDEEKKAKEDIPRPPSFAFSCHYGSIRVNRNNGYTQVILKPTRANAAFLTLETLTELKDIVHRAGQDGHCHTFILNGVGDCFCLGLDLRPLLGPQKIKASGEIAVAVKECIEALSNLKKPLVAAVNGAAFGLGMTLLNHADITIASDTATFCMPQSSLGYFPEGGATLTLPQAVGSTVAMDLILRGRTITAQEAKDIGLISEVLDANILPYDLVSRVKVLAKNSLPSMETTKAMLKMRLHLELLMVLENEVKLLPQMWLSQSCQEALESASVSGGLLAD